MNPLKFATTALATTTKTISTTMMPKSAAVERSILCSDGVRIAYQHYPIATETTTDHCPILCIHGWLDNAASFHLLAPYLSSSLVGAGDGVIGKVRAGSAKPKGEINGKQEETATTTPEIVVLDLPGHGLSSHKSSDGPPQLLSEYAYYVAEVTSALSWDKFDIVGHSMGTGVGIVYAAAFPEHVRRMVLLEGAGPLARNASDCARHVRAACERRMRSNKLLYPKNNVGSSSSARVYPSIGAAIEARMDTARRFPGTQYLSEQAAHAMVARATIPAPSTSSSTASSKSGPKEEEVEKTPVTFRHDPRLQWPSLQYFTREQVDSLYESISCPTCLLTAEDGWPYDRRSQESVDSILKPTYTKVLPGSHHFHADPDTADAVAAEAVSFLKKDDFEKGE